WTLRLRALGDGAMPPHYDGRRKQHVLQRASHWLLERERFAMQKVRGGSGERGESDTSADCREELDGDDLVLCELQAR
ncbi:MAG: hypothetical protein ACXV4B_08420, partial [Halobacteriota archaeon]